MQPTSSTAAPESRQPDPEPRHLLNLRDVSELAPQITDGILLRSEAPSALDETPSNIAWPPATVVDLRRTNEILVEHPFTGTARIVHLPLQNPALPSRSSAQLVADGGLAALYRSLLMDVPSSLVQFVSTVALEPPPILVHCAVGKDRTGIAVALVLTLVGVDRETVVADYLRTQHAMEQLLPRLFETHATNAALDPQARAAYAERFAALPPEMFQASEPAITSVLDHWESWDGGVVGWYLEHGGTDELLAQLKNRLLVP